MAYCLQSLAPKREVAGSSLRWIPISGFAWLLCVDVLRCRRKSVVLQQLKDPLEPIVTRRGFPPGSGFLPRHDMTKAVESDINTCIHTYIF